MAYAGFEVRGCEIRGAVGAEASSAAGARAEAPYRRREGGKIFFDFGSQIGELWCIPGAFYSAK